MIYTPRPGGIYTKIIRYKSHKGGERREGEAAATEPALLTPQPASIRGPAGAPGAGPRMLAGRERRDEDTERGDPYRGRRHVAKTRLLTACPLALFQEARVELPQDETRLVQRPLRDQGENR